MAHSTNAKNLSFTLCLLCNLVCHHTFDIVFINIYKKKYLSNFKEQNERKNSFLKKMCQ